jgi:hypothetical protein
MPEKTEQEYRRDCKCNDCEDTRKVLTLLDDIATSDCAMGMYDVDCLCEAREVLARVIGANYNEGTNRYD